MRRRRRCACPPPPSAPDSRDAPTQARGDSAFQKLYVQPDPSQSAGAASMGRCGVWRWRPGTKKDESFGRDESTSANTVQQVHLGLSAIGRHASFGAHIPLALRPQHAGELSKANHGPRLRPYTQARLAIPPPRPLPRPRLKPQQPAHGAQAWQSFLLVGGAGVNDLAGVGGHRADEALLLRRVDGGWVSGWLLLLLAWGVRPCPRVLAGPWGGVAGCGDAPRGRRSRGGPGSS